MRGFIVGTLRGGCLMANYYVLGPQSEERDCVGCRRFGLIVEHPVYDPIGALPRSHHTPAHSRPNAFHQRLMGKENLSAVDHAQQQAEKDQQDEGRFHHALTTFVLHRSLSPGANRPTKGYSTAGRPLKRNIPKAASTV